ncbi:unnamed protein product [Vitrella brassicaformis CCMP3155]|uniref:Uncharacterized protein n=1 Tax=Vitrella brassicaformis (strain CCMP3155) TaxID=1169540 RepID=A0A0G4ECV1_VITBC|nr:unnamed protein product [Vitrella brassicaformis CCMP3155]|eukprot:CEL93809.1 unnamed protein product [Vitrella brassicaformis CCMP3155]
MGLSYQNLCAFRRAQCRYPTLTIRRRGLPCYSRPLESKLPARVPAQATKKASGFPRGFWRRSLQGSGWGVSRRTTSPRQYAAASA